MPSAACLCGFSGGVARRLLKVSANKLTDLPAGFSKIENLAYVLSHAVYWRSSHDNGLCVPKQRCGLGEQQVLNGSIGADVIGEVEV